MVTVVDIMVLLLKRTPSAALRHPSHGCNSALPRLLAPRPDQWGMPGSWPVADGGDRGSWEQPREEGDDDGGGTDQDNRLYWEQQAGYSGPDGSYSGGLSPAADEQAEGQGRLAATAAPSHPLAEADFMDAAVNLLELSKPQVMVNPWSSCLDA